MDDVSLVPVDHQPEFENISLVPVDHDPFSADGMIQQARAQLASQPQRLMTSDAPIPGDVNAAMPQANQNPNVASASGVPTIGQPYNLSAPPIPEPGKPVLENQQQLGDMSGPGPASGVSGLIGTKIAELGSDFYNQSILKAARDLRDMGHDLVTDPAYFLHAIGPSLVGLGVSAPAARVGGVGPAERVKEIHNVLDEIAQGRRTTAVLETDAGRIIAGGTRDLSRFTKGCSRSRRNSGESPKTSCGSHGVEQSSKHRGKALRIARDQDHLSGVPRCDRVSWRQVNESDDSCLSSQVRSMEMLKFTDKSLKAELDRIAVTLRVVFAAAVAERLLPAYVIFWRKTGRGDPNLLTEILERLWRDIDGIKMSPEELQRNIDLSTELIPQEDEVPWVPDEAWADDAAAAIVFALRARQNGKSQDAVWAARRAYDALDDFVTTQEDIDPSTAGAEERILSNPLVQAEFRRQQRDLRELVAVDRQDEPTLVQKIRQRARAEAVGMFNGS